MKKRSIMAIVLVGTMLFISGCSQVKSGSVSNEQLMEKITELETKVDGLTTEFGDYYGSASMEEPEKSLVKSEDIVAQATPVSNFLLVMFENKAQNIVSDVEVRVVFYDVQNNILSTDSNYISLIFPSKKYPINFVIPRDLSGNLVPYDHYEITSSVSDIAFDGEDASADVAFNDNLGALNNVMVNVENNGEKDIQEVCFSAEFYLEGQLVGASTGSVWGLNAGQNAITEIYPPTDEFGQNIAFDNYELSITSAYYTMGDVSGNEILY